MTRSAAYDAHPAHTLEIVPVAGRVRVVWNDEVVVETARALEVREAGHPPVHYFPIADAERSLLERSSLTTHCPFKGDAAYYTLRRGAQRSPDAVWVYEDPFDQVAAIRDHLAFYPDRVRIEVGAEAG